MRLIDQTLAVIGGTSGIGLATAHAAVAAGARVIIVGRDHAKLELAVSEMDDRARGELVTRPIAMRSMLCSRAWGDLITW